MRSAIVTLLLLVPAQSDDAPLVVAQVDAAVLSIAGYNVRNEVRPVADDVFLRRVMKDLVDAEPTEAELKAFVESTDTHKRPKKITELLADPRYGKFWARRFSEILFGDVNGQRWTELPELPPGREASLIAACVDSLASRLNKDKPWTEIVSGLLDARGTTEGDASLAYLLSLRQGKGYAREFAEKFPRQFLGIRLACARCHDHPYDKWTMKDYYGMAAFVVRQRAKVTGDHFSLKNKAISPALLELLTKSLIDNSYSLKHLLRVICNTQAYQMPTPEEAPEAASFRHQAALKAARRIYEKLQLKPPALPVVFEAPEGWARVMARAPAKALYLVPHKDEKMRTVELGLYEGKLDEVGYENLTGKIDPLKKSVQSLKAKDGMKIALIEVTGMNWCQLNAEGPVEYRFWVAVVDAKKPLHFRVGGAADLLDPWRPDFLSLLQSLSLK